MTLQKDKIILLKVIQLHQSVWRLVLFLGFKIVIQ